MTMLLPQFELHRPESLQEAVNLAKSFGDDYVFISGGTDLLPNFKCGLNAHSNVISLQRIPELKSLSGTEIGAGTTLADIAKCEDLPASVRECASKVASPLLRESATLGGNLMLDNRCHFFNQSYFWRNSLGYCLKADGDRCHVVPQIKEDGKNVLNNKVCVATHSSDMAPMLIALGASATFIGPDGERTIKLNDFYYGCGIDRFEKKAGEILVKITLPESAAKVRSAWKKLAPRQSIDFSVVAVAGVLELDGNKIVKLKIALGAVDTTPVLFDYNKEETRKAPDHYLFVNTEENMPDVIGKECTDELIQEVAKHVQTQAQPKMNVPLAPDYRKKMCGVLTRRIITEMRDAK
ncbi:MAG: FAD binding domain-containing protein [Planctomycetota bacterium]